MVVEFGYAIPAGPRKNNIPEWMTALDTLLPQLTPHFKSLWMTDHFFWDDDPTYEAWTVLAFIAARFPQFDLGPMVLGQSYRNPALTAKMAATLQDLSNGRLILGMGAGWKEDEYRAYGYPYPTPKIRVEQLEDALEIITRLWTEEGKVSYSGKHYQIQDAYCEPKPMPAPTLMIGGGGNQTMRLAAQYGDWWNLPDANITVYAEKMAILRQHASDAKRKIGPNMLRLTWFGRLAVARSEAEAIAYSEGQWTSRNALVGTPARVIEQMQAFIDLGVDYFMLDVLGLPNPDVLDMVLNEVLPALNRA